MPPPPVAGLALLIAVPAARGIGRDVNELALELFEMGRLTAEAARLVAEDVGATPKADVDVAGRGNFVGNTDKLGTPPRFKLNRISVTSHAERLRRNFVRLSSTSVDFDGCGDPARPA